MYQIDIKKHQILIISATLFSLLACILVYLPALNGNFIHDDFANIVTNENIHMNSLSVESIYSAAFSSNSGPLHRPVSMLSFAINYYYFGLNPFAFKITNLVLHLITGILVFIFIKKIVLLLDKKTTTIKANWTSVFISALWLLHPLQVSTTMYSVQRMTILAAAFSLSSLIFYINFRQKLIQKEDGAASSFLISAIFLTVGVLCKENAILTVLLMTIIEIFSFRFAPINKTILNKPKQIAVIVAVAIIVLFSIIAPSLYEYLHNSYLTRDYTLSERLLTQSRVVSNYIKWLLIPTNNEMGLYHDDILISKSLFHPASTLLSLFFLTLLSILAWTFRKNYPLCAFGFSWFIIGHLLESTVLPLEIAYEHRNYLPSIGLFLAIASVIDGLSNNMRIKRIVLIASAILALSIFSSVTLLRSNQWSNELKFAAYEARHHPNSARANHNLGRQYAQLAIEVNKKYKDEAYKYLYKANKLSKNQIITESSILHLSYRLGEAADPDLINSMSKTVKEFPLSDIDIEILNWVTKCNTDLCILPNDAAEYLINSALNNSYIHENSKYADVLFIKAGYWAYRIKNYEKAEQLMKKAILQSPNNSDYLVNYANFLAVTGKIDHAREILIEAEILDIYKRNKKAISKLRSLLNNENYTS